MGSITIRNLDDKLKANLRLRAARHSLSMEHLVLPERTSCTPARSRTQKS